MHSSNTRISIEIRHPLRCPDAGDALAAHAWLSRPHGRRADLCVSGAGEAASAARDRPLSAEHLAGSIHVVFASVCVVHRVYWGWRMRLGCSPCCSPCGFWRLLGVSLRRRRPRHRLAGGRVSIDRRRRLWRVRRVPAFGAIFDGALAGRSIDHYRACLPRPRDEAARFIAGVGGAVHPPADGAARIALARLPVAAASRGRHRRDRGRVRDTRHRGRRRQRAGGLSRF